MKLLLDTLEVDSFVLDQDPFSLAVAEPEAEPATDAAAGSRYCTLIGTCTTCWDTRCNCA
ncbi:MAG TPA: hypothetical protein VF746_30520 [Longimicrobium sp.]